MTKTKLIAGAVAVTVAAAFAGCSTTEEKNDYVDEVNSIQTAMPESTLALDISTAQSKGDAVDAFEKDAKTLEDAAAQLNEVNVPEEAQAGHDNLVAAVEGLIALDNKTAKSIDDASVNELAQIAQTFQKEQKKLLDDVSAAIDQINKDLGAE